MTIDLALPDRDGWQEVRFEVQGLEADLQSVEKTLESISVRTLRQEISLLKGSFTRLKNILSEAFLPVQQALIPGIRQALNTACNFAQVFADVMAGLFGQVRKETKTTLRTGGAAVRRFLADFDQIQRLPGQSGGGSSQTVVTQVVPKELSAEVKAIVDKILYYLKPLQNIDFSGAKQAFYDLKAAIEPITRAVFQGLEWAWFNLLVPISKWSAEQLLPAFLQTLTAGFQVLTEILNAAKPALNWIWTEILQPMAKWTGDKLLEGLGWLRAHLGSIGQWIVENRDRITDLLTKVGTLAVQIGAVKLALELLRAVTGKDLGGLGSLLNGALLAGAAFGVFSQAVEDAKAKVGNFLTGLPNSVKWMLNSLTQAVNGIVSAFEWAINGIISGINSLSIRFSGAFPGIEHKTFAPNIPSVTLPRIPALAAGAVLPANKPFLAVVGDQHHGTNVEAPLSTITDAVRIAMGDLAAGNMAGHEATVGVLQEILQAVLGIHIGDDAIAAAADRYRTKMALVKGV